MKTLLLILFSVILSATSHAGLSLKDLSSKVDGSDKCDGDDSKCKNKERLKSAATVGAAVMAAKLIDEMVIEYKIQQVTQEFEVIENYKRKHKELPDEAVAFLYESKPLSGNVVEPGKNITIRSKIEVVPGKRNEVTQIEEQLTIYDNENHSKVLKSLTKSVNQETRRGGRFENEFSFVMPKGMPQGIYPIKSSLLVNQKEAEVTDNRLQLVLFIDALGKGEILALAR